MKGKAIDSETIKAHVVTAVALLPKEKLLLKQILEEKSGSTIVLKTKVDASLIAGLYVRIEDKVFDATIKSRLERLKESLLT